MKQRVAISLSLGIAGGDQSFSKLVFFPLSAVILLFFLALYIRASDLRSSLET